MFILLQKSEGKVMIQHVQKVSYENQKPEE